MKKAILFLMVCVAALTATYAQKWDELSDEQKMMKLKAFRADNQKYLKDSLRMTPAQMTDIDNVNLCYLGTLDRIDRYAKDEARKEELADAISEARWAQLDVIMGKDKHDRYMAYIKRKLEKASKASK